MLGVNFDISGNSKAEDQLVLKGQLWNEQSGLGRFWGTNLLFCVLKRMSTNATDFSQLSYTATECKRIYFSASEMYLWGSLISVSLLLPLWGMWMEPLQWARWWCLRHKISFIHFSKWFLLTTGFCPPAHDSTGSMGLPVLDNTSPLILMRRWI